MTGEAAKSERDAPRILFLDDDKDLRDILQELIEMLGYPCDAIGTIEELDAKLATRTEPYELALLDINLGSEGSGIDAYRHLRAAKFRGRIVFLTGHARTHPLVQKVLDIGDAAVHDKPITVTQLKNLLERNGRVER